MVATGNGAACVMTFQAARLRAGQRLFSNSGSASMGYDLPAALGAAVALAERGEGEAEASARPRVICLAGDGSLQMNVQELQTLATHRLPVKIFVIDNHGYLSIRSSQDNFFEGRIGESPESGVGLPDWVAVAEAYGIDGDCASRILRRWSGDRRGAGCGGAEPGARGRGPRAGVRASRQESSAA